MRQLRLRRPSSDEKRAISLKDRMVSNWQIIFILSFIVAIAFILRAFFAYDYAVSGGFALSGGSDAAYHLRVIEHIMETGSHLSWDESLNYPFGQQNVNPFLMDWIVAIIATPFTFFGVSTSTAAAGVLVIITAVLGALTCIPIYLLGRDMFGRNAGIIASLLYAVCAIAVYRTVLSNGTESAFYGFFFVLMIYFLYKAVKASSNETFVRNKGEMKGYLTSIYKTNRQAIRYAAIAGVMFALVALTWNGFRPVVFMMVFIMIVQVIVDRIRDKDPTAMVSIYTVTLGLGMLIALPFYLLQGLWSLVFSGPFMIALLAIIVTVTISETKGRPWLLMIPAVAVAVLVFFIVMYFALPSLFSDMVNGNSIYLNPIYESLVASNTVTSLSAMASYYGWLTMWLPYVLVAYMIYRARERMNSVPHMFILTWVLVMLVISWRSSAYIFLAAPAYVIGGGAVLAWIIRKANISSYFSGFKTSGFQFKSFIKNLIRPVPLLTILMAVFLVGAPNAIYAIDAGISANEKSESDDVSDYLGAFSYYVRNDDTWKLNEAWRSMSIVDKSGALVTWGDYSSDAANTGGFDTVAGMNGAGASAISNMLLSSGDKEILFAMAVRLMDYHGMEKFRSKLQLSDEQFNKLANIIENPSAYINEILSNPAKYGRFSTDLTEENAMYVYAIYYLSEELGLTQNDAIDLYDAVCDACGNSINYIAVSAGMFPITTSDGSFFSTMAHLNNYYLDSNGSPVEFYTANSYGYLDYTDAMYDSVLWKAYIGPSPADYGYSSAIELFNALSLSDGSENTMAQPGFGMPNYQIAYWKVMYNPSPDATLDSDGWVEMDALGTNGAIELQEDQGGLINYMSGLPVILEYMPAGSSNEITGTVVSASGPVSGVRISVFDSDGIQRNTTFTDDNGAFSVYNPYDSGVVRVFVGSTSMSGGLEIEVTDPTFLIPVFIDEIDFEGRIFYDDSSQAAGNLVGGIMTVEIEGTAHGMKKSMDTNSINIGEFSFTGLVPDTYTITVKNQDGDVISTKTILPTTATNDTINVKMVLSTATVNITITDEFNAPFITDESADAKYITLHNEEADYSRTVKLDETGKVEAKVLPGVYVATVTDSGGAIDANYILFNVTFTVDANGSFTLTEKAQRYVTITVTNDTGSSAVVTVTNTVVSSSALILDSGNYVFRMPTAPIGSRTTDDTKYYLSSGTDNISYHSVDLKEGGTDAFNLSSFTSATTSEFTRTLTASDGSAVTGQVNFYSQTDPNLFISATTTSGGRINAWLPDGEYLVYAYSTNSSKVEAFIGEITINGTSSGTLQLVAGKTLTTKVLISTSGDIAIPFVPISIIDNNGTTINTVTDANGQFSHPVPVASSEVYTIVIPSTIGDFTPSVSQMSVIPATTTLTATIPADSPVEFGTLTFVYGDSEMPAKIDKVSIKLTSESGSITYETNAAGILLDSNGVPLKVPIGTYRIEIKYETGFYFSQNVTLTHSGNAPVTNKQIEVVKVVEVILKGLNLDSSNKVTDVVTIKAIDGGHFSGVHDSPEDPPIVSDKMYYLEEGKEFLIQVKNADGDKVWYYYTDSASAVNLSVQLESAKEIKGYVGHVGNGRIEITYGSPSERVVADVSRGNYTALLPNITAQYDLEVFLGEYEDAGATQYEYRGSGGWSGPLPESGILNMAVTGEPKGSDPDIYAANTIPQGSGEITFDVTVTGNEFQALFMSGGTGWEKIEFFSDSGFSNEIDFINGTGTDTFYVKATLADGIAYDSSTLSIIFKDASGNTIFTHVVTDIPGTSTGDLTIGRGEADSSSASEYNASILLKNDSKVTRKFMVTIPTIPGWMAVVTDSSGNVIKAGDSGTYDFSVNGLSETNVYIRLVGETTNSSQDLPDSFLVTVTAEIGTVAAGEKAVAAGSAVTVTMIPVTPDLGVGEHGATGSNIFNDAANIPLHTWIIIAAAILAFALIMWLGMKRGVFTRKK